MNDTFMKEKPVLPLILSMALPMVLSMLVNSLYNIIDSFFVAQISEEAMTALSLVTRFKISSMLSELDLALESTQSSPSIWALEITEKRIRLQLRDLCLL